MGQVKEGMERRQTIPKEKCPIETSIGIRKKEPGESVTSVSRGDKSVPEVDVF